MIVDGLSFPTPTNIPQPQNDVFDVFNFDFSWIEDQYATNMESTTTSNPQPVSQPDQPLLIQDVHIKEPSEVQFLTSLKQSEIQASPAYSSTPISQPAPQPEEQPLLIEKAKLDSSAWIKIIGYSEVATGRPWEVMKMDKKFLDKEGITDPYKYDWSDYGWHRWYEGINLIRHSNMSYSPSSYSPYSLPSSPTYSPVGSPQASRPSSPRLSSTTSSTDSLNLIPPESTASNFTAASNSGTASPAISLVTSSTTSNSTTVASTKPPSDSSKQLEIHFENGNSSTFTVEPNSMINYSDSQRFKSNFINCDNLVIEKNIWLSLIEMIPCGRVTKKKCNRGLKYFDMKSNGELINLKYKCQSCGGIVQFHNVTSKRVKYGKGMGIESANLEIVIGHILKGKTWDQYNNEKTLTKQRPMSKEVWERAERFIYLNISLIYKEHMESLQEEYKSKKGIFLSGDGAWGNRRNSKNGVYCVFDATNGKVIYQHIMSKKTVRRINDENGLREIQIGTPNYEGTSKGMEGYGFRQSMNKLEEKGILAATQGYVCDQDSSVLSQLKEGRFKHISIYHDIGHAKKNLKLDLEKILGKSKELEDYSAKISKWFISSMIGSRNYAQSFGDIPLKEKLNIMSQNCVRRINFWKSHYSQAQCSEGCPCYFAYIRTVPNVNNLFPLYFMPIPIELQNQIFSLLCGDGVDVTNEDKVNFYKITTLTRSLFSLRRDNSWIKYKLLRNKPKEKFINEKKSGRTIKRKSGVINCKGNADKLKAVEEAIQKLIDNIEKFVHLWSTCLCESFNAVRAKLIDKAKDIIKYWRQKCELVGLFWNIGKEEVVIRLYEKIGIVITPNLLTYLKRQAQKKEMDRIRHAGKAFKKREKELSIQNSKLSVKEKEVSKKNRDSYTSNKKKSTLDSLQQSNKKITSTIQPAVSSSSSDVPSMALIVPVAPVVPVNQPTTATETPLTLSSPATNLPSTPSNSTPVATPGLPSTASSSSVTVGNSKKRKRTSETIDFNTLSVVDVDTLVGAFEECNGSFWTQNKGEWRRKSWTTKREIKASVV